jgi:hypothetical protein
MTTIHRARVVFTACSLALLIAACGGGGSDSPTAQNNAPPASSNRAPTISGQPSTAISVGQAYNFKPTASDPDNDTLTFSVSNKPAWLSFNSSTGELTGTPSAADVGNFAGITLSVSDGKTNTALNAFTVAVTQISMGSATLSWGAPTSNQDGTALTNLAGFRVLYGRSPNTLDQSVQLDNPSLSTYLVTNLSPGTWYFAIVAINSQGVESMPTNVASTTI